MANAKKTELEGEVYYPSDEVVAQATVPNWEIPAEHARKDLQGFWAEQAEQLEWFQKWDKVLDDSNKPFYKWFTGAKVNIVHNCIDRHLKTWRKNKLALIWESEDGKEQRTFSYYAMNREVNRFANIIKAMGIKKGDRVTIYLPRIPEIIFAMLACAKIGAIHSVVFAGFSTDALQGRIEDSESKLLITADGSWIYGKIFELKRTADEALKHCASVENTIVVKRTGQEVPMEAGRDHWYHDLCTLPIANGKCPTEIMDSEDPLYILYTSGSTGKPKAIVHTHGGYMVGTYTTLKYVFDLKDEDRWWCAADPGWVTGHSYIVYGPLLIGATSFMCEGGTAIPLSEPLVATGGTIRRHGLLYRTNRHPRADAFRRGLAKQARPVIPAAAWFGWRTDQPGSMEVVLPCDREGKIADHGYLVADRDRDVHDHPHPGDAAQTRIGDAPLFRTGS